MRLTRPARNKAVRATDGTDGTDGRERAATAPLRWPVKEDLGGSVWRSLNLCHLRNLWLAFMLLLTVRPAFAEAPYAYTAPATMVTETNAVLNGAASPNGSASVAWFEWGTNSAYGNRTDAVEVGGGTGVVWVTNQITGLICTVYHCRLVVSNRLGVACGAEQVFACGRKVWAWGWSELGQTDVPAGLSNVTAIAAGWDHSLALRSDGTMAGWGTNSAGQISLPAGLSNVLGIAAGGYHSLAIKGDGAVMAWGWNIFMFCHRQSDPRASRSIGRSRLGASGYRQKEIWPIRIGMPQASWPGARYKFLYGTSKPRGRI